MANDVASLVKDSDELPADQFDWGVLQWLCSDRLSPGAEQTLGICHIFPGKSNPLHYHPNCEELLYVLSGQGRHSLNDEVVELRSGMMIRVPASVRHNLVNTGWQPLTCLISFSSGKHETVFLEEAAAQNP